MTERHVEAAVGGMRLRVPVCCDPETTQAVVEAVNRRLKEIELKSDRVDSQRFALLAAYSFASDLQKCHMDDEDETRSLLKILDRINDALAQLIEGAEDSR